MVCIRLESFVLSQKDESFFWQYLHLPQAIWKLTTTRSPSLRFLTLGPTCGKCQTCQNSANIDRSWDSAYLVDDTLELMTENVSLLHCQDFGVIKVQIASANGSTGDFEDDIVLKFQIRQYRALVKLQGAALVVLHRSVKRILGRL